MDEVTEVGDMFIFLLVGTFSDVFKQHYSHNVFQSRLHPVIVFRYISFVLFSCLISEASRRLRKESKVAFQIISSV